MSSMRTGCLNLMILIVFYVIPRLTTPVEKHSSAVVAETFPPYSVIVKIRQTFVKIESRISRKRSGLIYVCPAPKKPFQADIRPAYFSHAISSPTVHTL